MMTALVAPLFLSMLVKGAIWEYICLAYAISVFMMLFALYYWHNTDAQVVFLIWIPVTSLVMYEHQRTKLSMFLLTDAQEDLIRENSVLSKEVS
jgi:hypothetical protein